MKRGDKIFLVLITICLSLIIFSQVGRMLGIIYTNTTLFQVLKSEACTLDFEMIEGHYSNNLELRLGHTFRYIGEWFDVNVTVKDSEGKIVFTDHVMMESATIQVETRHENVPLTLDKGAYTITLEPHGNKSTDFEAKLTQLVNPELAHTNIIYDVSLGVGGILGFWVFVIYVGWKILTYEPKK